MKKFYWICCFSIFSFFTLPSSLLYAQLDEIDQAIYWELQTRRAKLGLDPIRIHWHFQWQAVENLCWDRHNATQMSGRAAHWNCGTDIRDNGVLSFGLFFDVFGYNHQKKQAAFGWSDTIKEGQSVENYAKQVLDHILQPAWTCNIADLLQNTCGSKTDNRDGSYSCSMSIWKYNYSRNRVYWRINVTGFCDPISMDDVIGDEYRRNFWFVNDGHDLNVSNNRDDLGK